MSDDMFDIICDTVFCALMLILTVGAVYCLGGS